MLPRACRRDPSNGSVGWPVRRRGFRSRPAAWYRHTERRGHLAQSGLSLRQTSDPTSMRAWFHRYASPPGSHPAASPAVRAAGTSSASLPRAARASTRRTFASTTGTCASNAKQAIAFAE